MLLTVMVEPPTDCSTIELPFEKSAVAPDATTYSWETIDPVTSSFAVALVVPMPTLLAKVLFTLVLVTVSTGTLRIRSCVAAHVEVEVNTALTLPIWRVLSLAVVAGPIAQYPDVGHCPTIGGMGLPLLEYVEKKIRAGGADVAPVPSTSPPPK